MENIEKKSNRTNLRLYIYIGLLINLSLLISSYWFSYSNFYKEIAFVSVILIISLLVPKIIKRISIGILFLFYTYFLFYNYNYFFVFGIASIVGIGIINFLKHELKIPGFVYSLIPLLILGHVIWFNILPFGFSDEFRLNIGNDDRKLMVSDISIDDRNFILSPSQSYGSSTWRSFERDGSIFLKFNAPIDLRNKTVEMSLRYEATGPIYINNELFYDPLWGTSVNIASLNEEFIYGQKELNLSFYENVPVEEFLKLTESNSVEEYILKNYNVDLEQYNEIINITYELCLQNDVNNDIDNDKIISARCEFSSLSSSSRSDNESKNNVSLDKGVLTLSEVFLLERNQSLQEFVDEELNNNEDLREKALEENYVTIENFIRNKFPQGVLMKDFTGNYSELEEEMNAKFFETINSVSYYEGWSSESKMIPMTFRGRTKFYGVFNDSININVKKKDLNLYNGSDSVKILIKDFDNNIIATQTIRDVDGIENRTTQESDFETFSFNIPLEKSGIYRIEFEHEWPSKDPDFVIENISFNSNKIMIDGSFLLWGPSEVYNNAINNTVRVRYWWSGYDQMITFNDNSQFDLNTDLKGSWVDIGAEKMSSFKFEKGKLIVEPTSDLAAFPNTAISWDYTPQVEITKSTDLKVENVKLIEVDEINITATKGTKISHIKIKILD